MPNDAEVLAELDLGEPSKELLEWAKKNINEDPDTKCKVIEDFRNLIYTRGECDPHRTDDTFLLRFLRARSFHLERSHRLMVNYYEFKENNSNFVENIHLKHLKTLGEEEIIGVPPYKDQTGRRMVLYRIGKWDPKNFSVDELFQATLIILELAILEQSAQILGGTAIFDLGDLSMAQAWYLTPSVASKVIQIMVTSFPIRIQAIHIVNQSWVFDMAFNVFKPFLDDRMKQKIFFHGDDWESLHQHIDPKCLPERYGGIHPDYNYNDWIEYFYRTEYIVKELRSLGYKDEDADESTDNKRENEEDSS